MPAHQTWSEKRVGEKMRKYTYTLSPGWATNSWSPFCPCCPAVPLSIPSSASIHGWRRAQRLLPQHERPGALAAKRRPGVRRPARRQGVRVFPHLLAHALLRPGSDALASEEPERGWTLQDTIPIKIVGGRELGFRGYGFKTRYDPGKWKVHVETTDGREIGRIYFTLENGPQVPRSFLTELD